MTIEELNELRENTYQFKMVMEDRQLPATYEDRILDLIDSEIARQSVTDEDVKRAIEYLNTSCVTGCEDDLPEWFNSIVTDSLRAYQPKLPCSYCELEPTEKIYAYGMSFKKIPINYCPNCGRELR